MKHAIPTLAPGNGLDRILNVMRQLRDTEDGCPWDVEQDFASIAPYTIEEAYEVSDAIARADMAALKDELGDLLLQVGGEDSVAYWAQYLPKFPNRLTLPLPVRFARCSSTKKCCSTTSA